MSDDDKGSEVIDLTNMDDESCDDFECGGEGSRRSQGPRSSKVLQDACIFTQPASAESPSLWPSSTNTQAESTVPHDYPLFMIDTSISSSDQPLQKAHSHAMQDSMVDVQQARDEDKRPKLQVHLHI
ncbi:hypothetical protein BU23DRAFT_233425 [Bimuria novae-zelandiae CBS 107.79]|uniref:Uncharacterized protein n=1 Tax=Bimuria novae-zelandiae CBS 107.79 TaxID=1447943 RepID=A0A6A5UX65_9PLEO|nr:hypothetical protein BU23DRAFT_233425 [Bimuria novae-zelandiae CBS 107.79]